MMPLPHAEEEGDRPNDSEPRHTPTRPLLSVLVPAYRYAAGVQRILGALASAKDRNYEVRIYDDSPDNEVAAIVERWKASNPDVSLVYRHNAPSLGTAQNWNSLLREAQGSYCVLMHHDEFPLGSYIDHLADLLRRLGPDVAVCDCILVHAAGHWKRHVPGWLRAWIARHKPQYLLRRNVIGPTGALVVRRELFPPFDEQLIWLVDVDMYLRLLCHHPRVLYAKNVRIGSLVDRRDSITRDLGEKVRSIEEQERKYLATKGMASSMWLGGTRMKLPTALIRLSETASWISMRVATRAMALLVSNAVVDKEVREVLRQPGEGAVK